ncbi:Glutamine synthetase [subsurface metagenome]
MHNLEATFMPKPIMGAAGSGMHVHQSLFVTEPKRNAFYDENDKYKLSKIAYNFIAGQMKHIKAMCAIICPTVSSYKRLVSGFEAPVYITWASMNRSALIRVPKWFSQKPESARIELRCPDPTCNPYLAFAVMLKAGLDGIKNNLMPPEPVEENIYQFDSESLVNKNIDILPTSLWEALSELKKSKLIQEVLGNHLFERYIHIKTKEWDEFKMQVTSWEINKYLDIY